MMFESPESGAGIFRGERDAVAKVEGSELGRHRNTMLTAKTRQFSAKSRAARAVKLAAYLAPTIKALQESGITSLHAIAAALNERGILTPRGEGLWHATQVRRVLARLRN